MSDAFLPERMKPINVKNLCVICLTRKKYIIHIKKPETSARSWVNTRKSYRAIEFNQQVWLKLYIDMNHENKTRNKCQKSF